MLSGEGKGSTDDEAEDGRATPGPRATPLRRAESLDPRPLRPAPLPPTKCHDCNGQMVALPSEFFLRVDSHREDAAELDDDLEDVSAWPWAHSRLASVCWGRFPEVGFEMGFRAWC